LVFILGGEYLRLRISRQAPKRRAWPEEFFLPEGLSANGGLSITEKMVKGFAYPRNVLGESDSQ
jgi:hypothetical protein